MLPVVAPALLPPRAQPSGALFFRIYATRLASLGAAVKASLDFPDKLVRSMPSVGYL
jgi:hypothetical protein